MTTWPDTCPTCGGAWKIRSRTMGAAQGQPHGGRCINGHWWHETASPALKEDARPPLFVIRTEEDARVYVSELCEVIESGFFDGHLLAIGQAVAKRNTLRSIALSANQLREARQ